MPKRVPITINQNENYCVYGLICPISLRIRYIGMSAYLHFRTSQHYGEGKNNSRKYAWISSLKKQNLRPIPVILKEFKDRKEAANYEKELIKKHFRFITNSKTIPHSKGRLVNVVVRAYDEDGKEITVLAKKKKILKNELTTNI